MSHLWPTKGARKYTMLCGQKKRGKKQQKCQGKDTSSRIFYATRWTMVLKY